MKSFLLRLFTWWNGQTFGTQLWTALYGELVGQDDSATGIIEPRAARSTRRCTSNGAGSSIPVLQSHRLCRRAGSGGCTIQLTCHQRRTNRGSIPGRSRTGPISPVLLAHTVRVGRHWRKGAGPRRLAITSRGFRVTSDSAGRPGPIPGNAAIELLTGRNLETPLNPLRPYSVRSISAVSITRIVACLLVIGGIVVARPASAQFGTFSVMRRRARRRTSRMVDSRPSRRPPGATRAGRHPNIQRSRHRLIPGRGSDIRSRNPIRSHSPIRSRLSLTLPIPAKERRRIRASLHIRRSQDQSKHSHCRRHPALRSRLQRHRGSGHRGLSAAQRGASAPPAGIHRPRRLLPPRLRMTRWSKRRRRTSTTAVRYLPVSTRSPAAPRRSTPPSAKRCNSARSR